MSTTDDYIAALPRKRMGAAVLFTDGAGRAIIAEPVYEEDVPRRRFGPDRPV